MEQTLVLKSEDIAEDTADILHQPTQLLGEECVERGRVSDVQLNAETLIY